MSKFGIMKESLPREVLVREKKIAALESQVALLKRALDTSEAQLKASHRVIGELGVQKSQLLASARDTTSLSALYRGNEKVMEVIVELLEESHSSGLSPLGTAEILMGVIWGHRLKLLAQEPTQEMLNSGRLWTRRYANEMDLQRAIWMAMYDAA